MGSSGPGAKIHWVIPGRLARSHRPGYTDGSRVPVPGPLVADWCASVREAGIRSILCLLADEHLGLYRGLTAGGLLDTYRARGFEVGHVPVVDHRTPPLNDRELERAWELFLALPPPALVHCSAGVGRTGCAVEFLAARLAAGR